MTTKSQNLVLCLFNLIDLFKKLEITHTHL